MAATGAFTFVLHSHLPYARQAGMWPHGEEWVHEAIAETYLPLLDALYDLRDEGVPFHLTIGITPILAEQLADSLIIEHFVHYAAERAAWAADDVSRFSDSGDVALQELARHYHHWYGRTLASFQHRFDQDLLGAFRKLQDEGYVEIATSAATHGYLPLLSRDSSIYGQLHTARVGYRQHFGREPRAIWLPECAYRPAFVESNDSGSVTRPGLESFLAGQGLGVFFSETHTVEGGRPVGKAAGEAFGPYGAVSRRYVVQELPAGSAEHGTTFHPYWVGDEPGKVAVLARNNNTGQQVWSATFGYPGDFWYREFHKKDGVSGLQYWRIGGAGVDLADKPLYEPRMAEERIADHARHFAELVEANLLAFHEETGESGVISAAYDTELFGHWWFEGVSWLKEVLRLLAQSASVELTTASKIIEDFPPDRVLALPESSWGSGGGHFTWMNIDTKWMWPLIHAAENRMESLVELGATRDVSFEPFLNQAARELLLLEGSDWPFLVTTGQAKEYASQRFTEHFERFNQVADIIESKTEITDADTRFLEELSFRDNPFPGIDYRDFAERQGLAYPIGDQPAISD